MNDNRYSTFWPRFWAGSLDGLIFLPVSFICPLVFWLSPSIPLRILAYVISSGAFLIYQIYMHGTRGQTLGKMACKVIVLDVSERPLSVKQAIWRDIFGVVLLPIGLVYDISLIVRGLDPSRPENMSLLSWIIVYFALAWFLIEIVTMLTNNKRRALHDFIAGSVVIRKA